MTKTFTRTYIEDTLGIKEGEDAVSFEPWSIEDYNIWYWLVFKDLDGTFWRTNIIVSNDCGFRSLWEYHRLDDVLTCDQVELKEKVIQEWVPIE